jgi:hypothetical protein
MVKGSEHLIVVRSDARRLYEELQAQAGQDEGVRVILDRRRRDRRVVIQDVAHERRRGDRRSAVAPAWDPRGFFVVRTYRPVRPKPGNGFHNCLELPPALTLSR